MELLGGANLSQLRRTGVEHQPRSGGTRPGPEPKPPPAGPRLPGGGAASCGGEAEPQRLRHLLGSAEGWRSGTPGRWNLRKGEGGSRSMAEWSGGKLFKRR